MIEPSDDEDFKAYTAIHVASYVLMGAITLLTCVSIATQWL